ncbi:MAG: hypothetical protein PSY14_06800 [bacterium]|nr:hypothetical protein [bacterium]
MIEQDKRLHISHETIGLQWAGLLKQNYNTRHAAKSIARDFNCEPRTAKSWLAGQHPQLRHFMRAMQLFGVDAVLGVLVPETQTHRSKLHDDLLELRSRLDRLSKELGNLHNVAQPKTRPRRGPDTR